MDSEKKLNTEKIKNVPGRLYYKEACESTNLDAKMAESVPDKSVFLTDFQSKGRGRVGREWTSPSGLGIFMSIYLEPELFPYDICNLTLVSGLAVQKAIPKSEIKWPNDIILSGKKVGGILTETSAEGGKISRIIVGIGINVNNESFPFELSEKATSIFLETGIYEEREKLISHILKEFFSMYDRFLKEGFSAFKEEYERKCITIGKEILIADNGGNKIAKAVGITEKGELVTECDGKTEIVNSNEVSVRGLLGYV